MIRTRGPVNHRRLAAIAAACLMQLALGVPAAAMQILEAADNAELAAEISATLVNRIALSHDRIAKVVRAPDGFAVEHDAASGDLYLRPAAPRSESFSAGFADHEPVTLFIGTEKGFTYRLTLTLTDRDSAQILIRNGEALMDAATLAPASGGGPHVAALVSLVLAVARREPLPGYAIRAGGETPRPGLTLIETWRGPRFSALVIEVTRPPSAGTDGVADLAGTIGGWSGAGRVAALWLAAPGTGISGGRLAVAVVDTVPAGDLR